MNAARCESCRAAIVWAKTPKGRPIPLDPEPTASGNVEVDLAAGVARVLTKAEAASTPLPGMGGVRYRSHFATCPNARQHRKGPMS